MLVSHESSVTSLESLNLVISEARFHVKYLEAQRSTRGHVVHPRNSLKNGVLILAPLSCHSSNLQVLWLALPSGSRLLCRYFCCQSHCCIPACIYYHSCHYPLAKPQFRCLSKLFASADSVFGGMAQFAPKSRVPAPKKLRVRICTMMCSPPRTPHFAVIKAKWRHLENEQLTTTHYFFSETWQNMFCLGKKKVAWITLFKAARESCVCRRTPHGWQGQLDGVSTDALSS